MIVSRFALVLLACSGLAATAWRAAAQDPPAGKVPYDRVCKVCHGDGGQGDAGPRLVPFEHEVDEVLAIVREGLGQMPPIAETRVSDDEVKSIVAYLTALDSHPPDAK